ncbi:Fc.00g001570.m01.CDS01 [Cosmosporella sp. VM-42]
MSGRASNTPSGVPGPSDPFSHFPDRPTGQGKPNAISSRIDQTIESRDEVLKMLQTQWDTVYAVTSDGQTYTAPAFLRGVPVSRLEEANPYWERSWDSLSEYLNKEPQEELLKRQSHDLHAADPHNKALKKKYKNHQDNVSKHRKIREIFGGESRYHPNQLVAKRHMPAEGLCRQELMYTVACKVSDLQVLKLKGELSMDPFDFLRWRIGRKANSLLNMVGDRSRNIKTIISNICSESSETSSYEDALLRKAILRSARYSGRLNNYGTKGNSKPAVAQSKRTLPHILGVPTKSRIGTAARVARAQDLTVTRPLRPAARRERPSRPSKYQGVNTFRAQMQRGSQAKGSK